MAMGVEPIESRKIREIKKREAENGGGLVNVEKEDEEREREIIDKPQI